MERRNAFILSLISTFVIIFFISAIQDWLHQPEEIDIVLAKVVDGDTIISSSGETFRLVNINSPEKGNPGYNLSSIYLSQYINTTLHVAIIDKDKYNRTLIRAYSEEYINLEIVKKGLASKFLVQEEELKEFSRAESFAISNSLGMWEKSEHYGCFTLDPEPKDETVLITVSCPSINEEGWFLKDESRKKLVLQDIHPASVTIRSGKGKSNSTDIFWNSNENILNNDRDTVYLFDSFGHIAAYSSYGYH